MTYHEKGCYGVRVKYDGNVLCCASHRTTRENRDVCLAALALLYGVHPLEVYTKIEFFATLEGVTIELYRSYGASQ